MSDNSVCTLGAWSNACLIVWAFPIPPIIVLNLNMSESPWVHTSESNRNPIWIWSWNVKRSYATKLTECVLCCMRAKSVGCKKFFGISKKIKLFRRDNEVSVAPHGTIRTVAVPSYNTTWCLDSPPYSPAMTSSIMDNHIWFHSRKL